MLRDWRLGMVGLGVRSFGRSMSMAACRVRRRPERLGVRCVRIGTALCLGGALALGACDEEPRIGEPPKPIAARVVLGTLGDTPGRFAYPRCLEAGRDGTTLWVIDKSARIQQIDAKTGACITTWRMPEWDLGKPVGFTVAPGNDADGKWVDGLIYVADTHYHRVMIYEPPNPGTSEAAPAGSDARLAGAPRLVGSFGSFGTEPGQFYFPTDVAVLVGADGRSIARIYVTEYGGNDRVNIFDGSFKWLASFGHEGPGKNPAEIEFNRPQSLAIWTRSDGSNEVIVVDSSNHRLGRFTLEGKLIGWIGSPRTMGDALGAFKYPYGIHILADGTALVAEFGGCRVQRVDLETGRGLQAWGVAGRGAGELAAPWAVTTMGNSVYVLDSGNNRIMGFAMPTLKY